MKLTPFAWLHSLFSGRDTQQNQTPLGLPQSPAEPLKFRNVVQEFHDSLDPARDVLIVSPQLKASLHEIRTPIIEVNSVVVPARVRV
jgi:hypothetical protein